MGRTALAFAALVLPALAACALAACFEVPVLPARDAAGRDAPRRFEPTVPTLLGVEALDVAGRGWPLDALPRSLVLRIGASVPLAASEEDVLIVRGSADSALRDDLARRPLTEATRARRIAADVRVDGSRLVLRPREPLEPGARITVAVAAFAASVEGESLAEAWLVEGVVSSAPDAGARAVAAFPADGTPDVPTNAEPFVLAFDGEIVPGEGAVILRASDRPIEHALGLVRCAPLGFEAPGCLVVAPLSALPEGQSLTLETTAALRDATGASVPRSTISMVTALATDVRPPAWLAPSACPLDARGRNRLRRRHGSHVVDRARDRRARPLRARDTRRRDPRPRASRGSEPLGRRPSVLAPRGWSAHGHRPRGIARRADPRGRHDAASRVAHDHRGLRGSLGARARAGVGRDRQRR
jgi:hypothetical protein